MITEEQVTIAARVFDELMTRKIREEVGCDPEDDTCVYSYWQAATSYPDDLTEEEKDEWVAKALAEWDHLRLCIRAALDAFVSVRETI